MKRATYEKIECSMSLLRGILLDAKDYAAGKDNDEERKELWATYIKILNIGEKLQKKIKID